MTWSPPTEFPDLRSRSWLSIDLETNDPHLKERGSGWPFKDGHIAGVSVTAPGFTGYYPIGHEGGGNLEAAKVLGWLRDEAAHFEGTLHGANLLYDLGWLGTEGVEFSRRTTFNDCQWVEALIDEDRPSYSLQALTQYHGLPGKATDDLDAALLAAGLVTKEGKPDKGQLWRLPANKVGAYAERDTTAPVDVWERQRPIVAAEKLEGIIQLEHRLLPLLLRMRRRGVRVDLERAASLAAKLLEKERDAMGGLVGVVPGLDVNVWSNDDVAKVFDALGVHYPRTELGAPSFTKEWLAVQALTNPTAAAILNARRYQRARTKFVETDILGAGSTGRVHAELHPLRADRDDDGNRTGTVSGRFAASNPNLQQVPARDQELGPLIRSCYLPDEGGLWCSGDYSQQEPRLTIHYAYLMSLEGAAAAVEQFQKDPSTDYHQMVADITGLPRKRAKEVNLGVPYGMGGAKLCEVYLGLPTKLWTPPSEYRKPADKRRQVKVAGDEGAKILRQFHSKLPYLKQLMADASRVAEERGYLITLAGRRCRFQLWMPKDDFSSQPLPLEVAEEKWPDQTLKRAFTHKALNRIIQGGAGDMIKLSLLALDDAGLEPQITIHDENCLTIANEADAHRVAEVMNNCVSLSLPLKTDLAVGPSWGEAKDLLEQV